MSITNGCYSEAGRRIWQAVYDSVAHSRHAKFHAIGLRDDRTGYARGTRTKSAVRMACYALWERRAAHAG